MGIDDKKYNETFRILRQAKNDKRLVLFVGAGASADSGMPLWGNAVKIIADALAIEVNGDDMLKIPQYYFNARGRKEYNELMRRIFRFGDDLNTTELHKTIIGLGTPTIITTNYDHLIEKAAEENGEVMQVVSQDSDLPYLRSGRQLIKIHGDFEHDNYVLKEDDYLQYSENFKLIETYIKSIIGSKVVLFIGYSLNDPDVKQIFSWSKDILDQNFQRAYMILTQKEPNDIERDYFKNLGVNIIYANELVNDAGISHSKQIISLLNNISSKKFGAESKVDELYNKLKPYEDLNYVYGKYIKRVMNGVGFPSDYDSIDIHTDSKDLYQKEFANTLWNYFEKNEVPENVDERKLQLIKAVIEKSPINTIKPMFKSTKSVEITNGNYKGIEDLIINFDYEALHLLKEKSLRNGMLNDPQICMQQAYIYSIFGDYELAYNYIKDASTRFYMQKEYVWYYIAMVNKKYIGRFFNNPFIAATTDNAKQIAAEANDVDLDAVLNSIPNYDDNDYSFLKELGSFTVAYTLFYDVFKDSVKTIEQSKTNYTLFAGTPAYEKLRLSVKDYTSYLYRNYITLDNYSELISIFELYIRSIFPSLIADRIEPHPDEKLAVGNIRPEEISQLEIFIIIKYISIKEFQKMIRAYNIKKIPVDDNGMDYLRKILPNISRFSHYNRLYNNEDGFWRYVEFVSYVNITSDFALEILKVINSREGGELQNKKDVIVYFARNICNHDLYTTSEICDEVKVLIDKIVECCDAYSCRFLLRQLTYLLYKGTVPYDDLNIVKLANANNIELLIDLYDKVGENVQSEFKAIISEWNPTNNSWNYCRYCEAVLVEAVEPDKEKEKELFKWILAEMSKTPEPASVVTVPNYSYSDVISSLINLFLNNKIDDEPALRDIVLKSNDESSKWMIDMETYDYSKFDCNWLKNFNDLMFEYVAKNPTAVKGILNAYKKQYNVKNIPPELNEKIVKYFI